jgi:hypothetical protein
MNKMDETFEDINEFLNKMKKKYERDWKDQNYRLFFSRVYINNVLGCFLNGMESEWVLNRVLDDLKNLLYSAPMRGIPPLNIHDKSLGT